MNTLNNNQDNNNKDAGRLNLSIEKSTLKDTFFYFFAFATLCYSIYHFLSITFDIINKIVPDIIDSGYNSYTTSADSFRFSVASLAIVFPVFIIMSWYINRAIERDNALAQIKVRAVFIWLSITVSIITVLGSAVSVLYTYLGGEYTARFFFKALAVFLTASIIGAYYIYLLKRDYRVINKRPLIMSGIAIVIMLSTIIYGISVIGSPSEIRNRKLDGQRLNNISAIETNIIKYLDDNKSLPKSFVELVGTKHAYDYNVYIYKDPVTGEYMKYKVINNTNNNWQYQLCSNFSTAHQRNVSGNDDYEYYGVYISGSVSLAELDYTNYKATIDGDDLDLGHKKGENCFTATLKLKTINENNINSGTKQIYNNNVPPPIILRGI